jgi:hypothetical protein
MDKENCEAGREKENEPKGRIASRPSRRLDYGDGGGHFDEFQDILIRFD